MEVYNVDVVKRSRIDGEFEGFDSDMLFKLMDGTYWLQDEYKYSYQYAYNPEALVIRKGSQLHLLVNGRSDTVRVKQVTNVIESRIEGSFNGWNGRSEYKLANGQVWRQADNTLKIKIAISPRVIIYKLGMCHVMMVKGTRAKVERVK